MDVDHENPDRIYIREAAAMLNRRIPTLRKWDRDRELPDHLSPKRGFRGWRYWTPEQMEGIRQWLRDTDKRPGKSLPHYNPTEEQLNNAIAMMRQPRGYMVKTTSGVEIQAIRRENK